MNLYIDKDNLLSLVKSQHDDSYEDCCRLIRRQLNVVFGFEKTELNNMDESERLQILNQLDNGRGWKEDEDSYNSTFLDNNKKDSIFWMFLLNETNSKKSFKENILFGKVGDEKQVVSRMFCGNDYTLHNEYNPQSKASFPSWEKLKLDGHSLPCSDIIIQDRYLFDNQYDLVASNLYKFIEVLTISNNYPANIVFITIGDKSTNWSRYINEIKSRFNVNVTFVLAYKDQRTKNFIATVPHDRIILTNYRRYVSGDSLLFFKTDGSVLTTGEVFKVDSMADSNIQSLANDFVNNTQNLCDTIRKKEFGLLHYIIGDKKSNLIKFQ